jgi:hypothetical protein
MQTQQQHFQYMFSAIDKVYSKYSDDTDVKHLYYAFNKLQTNVNEGNIVHQITDEESEKINNTKVYTIDYSDSVGSIEELEVLAELTIFNETQFYASRDLGGLTVYFAKPENNEPAKLVAFYDYEQQRGTVFGD